MAFIRNDIRDIIFAGEGVRQERELPVRIAVFVDASAPDSLVDGFQAALTPVTSGARVHVELVRPAELLAPDAMADAVIALAGPGHALKDSLRAAREALVPTVAVALEPHRDEVARRLQHPISDTVAEVHIHDVLEKTAAWVVERDSSKKLALASNFPFLRQAVAEQAVRATAMQNGLIGGVLFIPGADMPVMTANQAKMILQIAGVYGETLGAERMKELAAVVGGGFAFRAIARNLVGLVPGFGWAIKAAIGYSGTWAMGKAAIEYFESGGSMAGLVAHVTAARDKAVDVVARRRRGGPVETPAFVVASGAAETVVIDAAPAELPPASSSGEPPR